MIGMLNFFRGFPLNSIRSLLEPEIADKCLPKIVQMRLTFCCNMWRARCSDIDGRGAQAKMTNLTKEKREFNTLLSAPTSVTGISIHKQTTKKDILRGSATEMRQWLSIARREYELFKTRNSKITRFLSNATDFDKAQTDLDQKIRHIRRLSMTETSRAHPSPSEPLA